MEKFASLNPLSTHRFQPTLRPSKNRQLLIDCECRCSEYPHHYHKDLLSNRVSISASMRLKITADFHLRLRALLCV